MGKQQTYMMNWDRKTKQVHYVKLGYRASWGITGKGSWRRLL